MKDLSASLRRRDIEESGRNLTTDCSSNICMNTDHLGKGSETGVPILELDALSPVTKNNVQFYSEKPHHLGEHTLAGCRTPPLLHVASQSLVTKNSSDVHVCGDENRTPTTGEASPIIVTRSPLRRSVRIAKRRSIGQHAPSAVGCIYSPLLNSKDGSSFPVPSLLSPVSCYNNTFQLM